MNSKKDGNFSNERALLETVYQKVQRKVEKYKVSHSEKPGREKALNFVMSINIMPPNYSFVPEIASNYYFAPR